MPIRIVDPTTEYELKHQSGAVFRMRHWTVAMQEIVDRECISVEANGDYKYNVTRERQIKVDQCVVSWDGVEDDAGSPVPCTPEAKGKLPVGVIVWIVKEVDVRAGLRYVPEEKKS